VRYPRQIGSHMTHWKGGPRRRVPYRAYPSRPLARLAVAGDIGHAGRSLDATGAAVAGLGSRSPYDALLLLGDHAYPRGEPRKLGRTVFAPFGAVLAQGSELLAVLGNHDVLDGHAAAQMRALGMPGRWWVKELPHLLLVGLDSNAPEDPAQLEFLERVLTGSTARWKVVALHHPPYSAGYQRSHRRTREVFTGMFERFGVQLVLSAHDHDYQRSVPIGGVTYVVTGGAARARLTGARRWTAASYRVKHFVEVAAFADRLVVRAIDQRTRVFDEVAITADHAVMRGSATRAS
jgi:Calcineurin-like phosphoesterase